MRVKNRFGSGTKARAAACAQCKAEIAIGQDRWFDNTTYPRMPICTPCKLNLEAKNLPQDADVSIALAKAVWTALEPQLDKLADQLAEKIAAKLKEPF